MKVFELRGDSFLQLFAQGTERLPTGFTRAIADAGPKPWAFEPDLPEYRPYNNRSPILVVERRAAAATVVLPPKVSRRLARDDGRLSGGQQLASLLQRKAQLLEIFVRPIDHGNLNGFGWRTTVPILQTRFDDYSHGVASLVTECP